MTAATHLGSRLAAEGSDVSAEPVETRRVVKARRTATVIRDRNHEGSDRRVALSISTVLLVGVVAALAFWAPAARDAALGVGVGGAIALIWGWVGSSAPIPTDASRQHHR